MTLFSNYTGSLKAAQKHGPMLCFLQTDITARMKILVISAGSNAFMCKYKKKIEGHLGSSVLSDGRISSFLYKTWKTVRSDKRKKRDLLMCAAGYLSCDNKTYISRIHYEPYSGTLLYIFCVDQYEIKCLKNNNKFSRLRKQKFSTLYNNLIERKQNIQKINSFVLQYNIMMA